MSADFWAGYLSGATGILIGNPLDLIKTRVQAGHIYTAPQRGSETATRRAWSGHFEKVGSLVKGSSAPILGYGALNALLFVTYNRTLSLMTGTSPYPQPYPALDNNSNASRPPPSLLNIFTAGCAAGLATWLISAPTELIKCQAQVSAVPGATSWSITQDIWRHEGVRGLYYGGGVTSARDAVGYGFYFVSYEWSKKALTSPEDSDRIAALKVLLCGGLAGIATWVSIFPLDVIKTRVQTQSFLVTKPQERQPLIRSSVRERSGRLSTIAVARLAYQTEGIGVFFRGLGVCSVRAFIVNAVQWAVYEWMMKMLKPKLSID